MFTGRYVSPAELIAYQMGWVRRLIKWYECGKRGERMSMPGDGFSSWRYTEMAIYFYEKYWFDGGKQQDAEFERMYYSCAGNC
ncbi:ClbS/DfsB family four-helix bundle protein [Candidatus Dependentiae bacterium]|nr:ClbS/DfsB family four-helix bundle protein [Candidatus Dependentiae bacterium]